MSAAQGPHGAEVPVLEVSPRGDDFFPLNDAAVRMLLADWHRYAGADYVSAAVATMRAGATFTSLPSTFQYRIPAAAHGEVAP